MRRPLLDWLSPYRPLAVGFKFQCDPGCDAPPRRPSSTNQEEAHRTVDFKRRQLVVVVM